MKKTVLKSNLLWILFTCIVANTSVYAQKAGKYKIISYNLENLYDTVANPKINDQAFTPNGKFEWNTERYQSKIKNLSKVVSTICGDTPLLFLGVNEVENKKVLKDWIKDPLMQPFRLSYIRLNSIDPRGMEVALLYNKKLFKPMRKEILQPSFEFDTAFKARAILYVKGKLGKEEVHVFINHWSTRRGGAEKSDPRRIATAKLLKAKIDEINATHYNAKIILLGDFSDPPFAYSVSEALNAKQSNIALKEKDLFNLMSEVAQQGQYTFDFEGEQDLLDQIIVSSNLVSNDCELCIDKKRGNIFKPQWLMYKSSKFGPMPFRTYEGTKYVGGYSDHLPVYCDFLVK